MAHRDVAVNAQRALLHVAGAGAETSQDRAQLAQVDGGLLGAPSSGRGDRLHHAAAGNAVAAPENSFALAITWACTSRPMTTSDGPVLPSISAAIRRQPFPAACVPCVLRDAPLRGAPQDEEGLSVALKAYLILRR